MANVIEENFDRGVVAGGHPPIIIACEMATTSSELKAGTILKLSSGSYAAAGASDTPDAVLVEDVAAHSTDTVTARIIVHGLVVKSRLLTGSSASADTIINKLPARGIYPVQAVFDSSDYR